MKSVVLILGLSFFLTGCLKTRNDVRENEQRQVVSQQVANLQKTNADASSRVLELEEQLREMNGRIDVVENKYVQGQEGLEQVLRASQQQNVELSQRVGILQEALTKMEGQVAQVSAELQSLRSERAAAAAKAEKIATEARAVKKDAFAAGQSFFEKKDWKQSILSFQKYRDENPKGSKFPDATYKIGVSFQELGMKDEAKTFYDEVVSKFPKSEEARRAKIRLKGLKK